MRSQKLILSTSIGSSQAACDPVFLGQVIKLAEAAYIDLLLLGETSSMAAPPPFDPLVIAGWLAPRTRRVGLVPLVPALHAEPYHVARALSALDFLTGGRSGWQPSTATRSDGGSVATPILSAEQSLMKARDFLAATRSLWSSWDSDALIVDQASGVYLNPDKVRRNNYRGPFFQVLGPLNAARPPQGEPILVQNAVDPMSQQSLADVLLVDLDGPQSETAKLRLAKVALEQVHALGIERIEALFHSGSIDGIHLAMLNPLAGLTTFLTDDLPTLRRRGLVQTDATCLPLRTRFGLTR